MNVEVQIPINGSRQTIWAAMTDIENSAGTSSHDSQPQGIVARIKALPMFLFVGVARKALLQDLNDIKSAAEGTSGRSQQKALPE